MKDFARVDASLSRTPSPEVIQSTLSSFTDNLRMKIAKNGRKLTHSDMPITQPPGTGPVKPLETPFFTPFWHRLLIPTQQLMQKVSIVLPFNQSRKYATPSLSRTARRARATTQG
jgi:hypothetical protein